MNGKGVASFQPPSPSAFASCFSFSLVARASVHVVTLEEYQPSRVLISVLFTPAARTCKRTSLEPSFGIGTYRMNWGNRKQQFECVNGIE
jgi:hypothetical protein